MELSGFFDTPLSREVLDKEFCNLSVVHSSERSPFLILRAQRDGRWHLLKTLKPNFRYNPLYRDMLRKEFEIGHGLNHPHIVKTEAWESIDPYGECVVLEWVEGLTLDQYAPKLNRNQALKIISELCSALTYIHSQQIVHRDIKPNNILITHNGQNAKLIDFGCADADNYAVLKNPAGTFAYAAPELIAGESVDARSDIYSLGIVFRECFGRFVLRSVIRTATLPNRSNRYHSAEELRKATTTHTHSLRYAVVTVIGFLVFGIGGYFSLKDQPQTIVRVAVSDSSTAHTFRLSASLRHKGVASTDSAQQIALSAVAFTQIFTEYFDRNRKRYTLQDSMPNWQADSLYLLQKAIHYTDSMFAIYPDSEWKKRTLSHYRASLETHIQAEKRKYIEQIRRLIGIQFATAHDPIADSLRSINPVRRVDIQSGIHGAINPDSLHLSQELQRLKNAENSRTWYTSHYKKAYP